MITVVTKPETRQVRVSDVPAGRPFKVVSGLASIGKVGFRPTHGTLGHECFQYYEGGYDSGRGVLVEPLDEVTITWKP